MSTDAGSIDAVYTWVDDRWPGYAELLGRYASTHHDRNPNRYRDNLDLLKYSLRSLAQHASWIRRVLLVTARPQVPAWLDRTAVRIVHHDEFMPGASLPTFNSFAIVSQLHRIADLRSPFIYVEDDHVFFSTVTRDDFLDERGRSRVFLSWNHAIPPERRNDQRTSPWNRALAHANHVLNERYGPKRRRTIGHAPIVIDGAAWRRMVDTWPDIFEQTATSRFRATGNVAPEHLYSHVVLEEGAGVEVRGLRSIRKAAYHPLNNLSLYQRAGFARIRLQRPVFLCLNDNYGAVPNARAVAAARTFLERAFPTPSRFELTAAR